MVLWEENQAMYRYCDKIPDKDDLREEGVLGKGAHCFRDFSPQTLDCFWTCGEAVYHGGRPCDGAKMLISCL
jgi:hypothetical protein